LKILVSGLFVLALTGLAFVQGFDSGEVDRIVEVLDIEPGEVVADVGAGDGRWSQGLAERVGESGRVYATEVDPGDLKRIRERVARAGLDNVIVVEGRQDDTGLPPSCCGGSTIIFRIRPRCAVACVRLCARMAFSSSLTSTLAGAGVDRRASPSLAAVMGSTTGWWCRRWKETASSSSGSSTGAATTTPSSSEPRRRRILSAR
jgi:SAM-dependent methyltransferase